MNVFLLWRHTNSYREEINPASVAERLCSVFADLFEMPLKPNNWRIPACNLVSLDLPTRKFLPHSRYEDDRTWVLTPQYPMNAEVVIPTVNAGSPHGSILPALCRSFETRPRSLLNQLAPPYSLIWTSKQRGEVYVQTDALGHAQLFEYQSEKLWALTNRVFALKALQIPLEPVSEEWAVRSTLGWFPGSSTGFASVRYLAPGTQVHIGRQGVETTRYDVLADWISQSPASRHDCLEAASASVMELVKVALPLFQEPHFSLSGGWDSRAIFAVLQASGAKFATRVHGPADHPDVVIAKQLSEISDIALKVSHLSGLPPRGTTTCRSCMLRALTWQAGGRNARRHKTFQIKGRFRDGGSTEISGQHGEIGRSYYLQQIRKTGPSADASDDILFNHLVRKAPSFMRPDMLHRAQDMIWEAIRQADKYNLQGLARWDFFYLYERTRRWSSARHAAKPGINFAPFLNPGFIRACFAFPEGDKTNNPFHIFITQSLMPIWTSIPYAVKPPREVERVHEPETLSRDGFWSTVFDPSIARQHWQSESDELAMIYLLPEALAN